MKVGCKDVLHVELVSSGALDGLLGSFKLLVLHKGVPVDVVFPSPHHHHQSSFGREGFFFFIITKKRKEEDRPSGFGSLGVHLHLEGVRGEGSKLAVELADDDVELLELVLARDGEVVDGDDVVERLVHLLDGHELGLKLLDLFVGEVGLVDLGEELLVVWHPVVISLCAHGVFLVCVCVCVGKDDSNNSKSKRQERKKERGKSHEFILVGDGGPKLVVL